MLNKRNAWEITVFTEWEKKNEKVTNDKHVELSTYRNAICMYIRTTHTLLTKQKNICKIDKIRGPIDNQSSTNFVHTTMHLYRFFLSSLNSFFSAGMEYQ